MKRQIGEFKVTDQRGITYVAFEYSDVLGGGTLINPGSESLGIRSFKLSDGTAITKTDENTFTDASGRRKFVRQSFD